MRLQSLKCVCKIPVAAEIVDIAAGIGYSVAIKPKGSESMRQTSDTRYPFKRMETYMPEYGEVLKTVHPTKRIILENRGARPDAKIILLLTENE